MSLGGEGPEHPCLRDHYLGGPCWPLFSSWYVTRWVEVTECKNVAENRQSG